MSRLEHVDVVDLHQAGDNPRRNVTVDDELVATIKSLGVLESLLVNKSKTNGYTAAAVRAKETADRAERDADYRRRFEFCAGLAKTSTPAPGWMSFAATMWIWSGEPDLEGAARLLGVDLPAGWNDKPAALAAWVNTPTGGPPWNAASALYALALAFGLDQTKGTWSAADDDEVILRPFFEHLAAAGYELSNIERQTIHLAELDAEAVS